MLAIDESSNHGFSIQLTEDATRNCCCIFIIQDLLTRFPAFFTSNAVRVLDVVQEVFLPKQTKGEQPTKPRLSEARHKNIA